MSFPRELSVQKASEFFKSATRNIALVVWMVRILAAVFLFLLFSTVYSVVLDDVKDFNYVTVVFQVLVLFFFAIILALLTLASFVVSPIANTLNRPGDAVDYFQAMRAYIINSVFGGIELLPDMDRGEFLGGTESATDPLAPLAYLINKPQRVLYNTDSLYGIILIAFILMLITGIAFIRKSSVALSGGTLVISQFIIVLAYMKELTYGLDLDVTSISSMVGSNLFQLALISYLYFEFSLQTGYIYSLTTPNLSRQERVGRQLARLSEFRLGVTKLGTEEEQKVKAAARAEEEEEEERVSSALAAGAGSSAARKFSADALIFLLDSAKDSMFAKPGGDQERLTSRLQRYHDGLLAHDKNLDDKLGGSAAKTFRPFTVLAIVVGSMILRTFLLIGFSWLVLNSSQVMRFIALPPAIYNSLELYEPEGTLVVLIPLIFFMIGTSYIISKLQERIVKQEELIIDESEIDKLIKMGMAIESREDMERKMAEQALKEQPQKSEEVAKPRRKKRKRKPRRQ